MNKLPEVRCKKCNALLLKGLFKGEIKCRKCGYLNKIDNLKNKEK